MKRLILAMVKSLLWLRYRVRVHGLNAVADKGTHGILFLPNHPALIDPVILLSVLQGRFSPRALADKNQVDRFFIRRLARAINVRPIPDMALQFGPESRQQVHAMLAETIEGLRRGENALLYPSGHVYRGRLEDLGGNSAVHTILQELPDVRVVLVRTRGLWGSSFSWAQGQPEVARTVKLGILRVLANGIAFSPRRPVEIELAEPADLPRRGDRHTINRYLEAFYNASAPPATYVPYLRWQRQGVRELAERQAWAAAAASAAPASVRELVIEHLKELSGLDAIGDSDRLANDLGLDSLLTADLAAWLQKEFGFFPPPQSLRTAGDVMLAALGEAAGGGEAIMPRPSAKWFWKSPTNDRLHPPPAATIAEAFLWQLRRHPTQAIAADSISGVRTYRDLATAALALGPLLKELDGEYLGIMLPAGVAADVAYLAAMFAGKTPVMVNWTVGQRNLLHSLTALGVRHVLTADALMSRLKGQGLDLSAVADRLVAMESLRAKLTRVGKILAAVSARCGARALHRAVISPVAAMLFTSGSENLPKAVPLTHANILANIDAALQFFRLFQNDIILGMLPPFHSFGLTVAMILPMCTGLRVCHHANPTEAAALAAVIEQCRPTMSVSTPTFLAGIARAARPGQMDSLRIAVVGAEKCPAQVYDAVRRAWPAAKVLEGYGITECSPIVCVNPEEDPRPGTIGMLLPTFERAVVDVETGRRVGPGAQGMLLVRGPSVFGGYLNYSGPSPFEDFEGKAWYRTGDVVVEDASGRFTFIARLKRFAKLGGEMVSLPAIEAALLQRFGSPDDKGPALAVIATEGDHPELVLFTVAGLTRQQANDAIAAAGLSPLHNIRRVVALEALPLLGTGKVDYRALAKMPD